MARVVHFEIYTDDPDAVRPFYQDVFGWKFQKFEDGPIEYWLVTTGDDKEPGINGGLARPREGQSPGTLNTIGVPALDQSIKKIEQSAGKNLSGVSRSRSDGQMASAKRIHRQGSSHGRQSWRQLQNVIYKLHDGHEPFLRRNVCRTDAARTHSLHGQI